MPHRRFASLAARFPPSPPCDCAVCRAFCRRPGWWTVAEAEQAVQAGYAGRMMLEMSPDCSFGVLSPAFRSNEGDFSRQLYSHNGCTFFNSGGFCELHGSGLQPLECRFCHHDRPGQGPICHAALERDWQSPAGRSLVVRWTRLTGLWSRSILPHADRR